MSAGISPYDFVQQVYYTQEKVILDFWPDDDKYKEVLMEANLVLQELQKEEDWNFMRREFLLGPTGNRNAHIRTFDISVDRETAGEAEGDNNVYNCAGAGDIYKPCTLYGDCIRLYRANSAGTDRANDWDFIRVPFVSTGIKDFRRYREHNRLAQTNVIDASLVAVYYDGKITFNRPLIGPELNRIAYMDIQERFTPIHICNFTCKAKILNPDYNPSTPGSEEYLYVTPDYSIVDPNTGEWTKKCEHIESALFTEIPDPNYMVVRTAYHHALGSPSAQGRIADLQDNSQKLLSAMRENNAAYTQPDIMDWEGIGYIDVI